MSKQTIPEEDLQKSTFFSRICKWTDTFWNSPAYFPAILVLTAIPVIFGRIVLAVAVLVVICTWMLLLCRDFFASVFPFLLIFLLSAPVYDNLSVFLPCAPMAGLLFVGLAVHLILWPVPLRAGRSAFGLALVSLASLLGGIGTISKADYFAPISLYYTLGLGLGLFFSYLLLSSELEIPHSYDLLCRLMQILYALGIAMALILVLFYVQNWTIFSDDWKLPCIEYRNFAAAILVSTLPAVFYMVTKHRRHLLVIIPWGIVMFFTGSRSALLFGGLILLMGCIYLVYNRVIPSWVFVALAAASVVVIALYGDSLFTFFLGVRHDQEHLIDSDEKRWLLLAQAWQDFRQHPLLGIGLGNTQNIDLFRGVPGSMIFYHNAVAQVLGSTGLLGAISYCVLVVSRIRLLLLRREGCDIIGFFYLGMLLVSMTNPGLFCPLPNALLTVLVFTVLEKITASPTTPMRQGISHE